VADKIDWTWMFTFCVGVLQIQPSEFWDMTLPETVALITASAPPDPKRKLAGSLTEADIERLKQWDPDAA
jgi:hypothetical protein